MRGLLFIGMLLALGIVAYLQMSQVKEHDMEKAETQIDQTREQVKKTLQEQEKRLRELERTNR